MLPNHIGCGTEEEMIGGLFRSIFCFAITLHNIEEAIWLPEWSQQSSKFQKPVTSNEFHFAVIVITMLAYLSAFGFYICQNQILQNGFSLAF